MPFFKKQVQQFAAQAKADKERFEDPNHVIDEDYSHMDRVCTDRLNSPDFGRPCLTRKRRAIGFLLVIIGFMILYATVGKYLG